MNDERDLTLIIRLRVILGAMCGDDLERRAQRTSVVWVENASLEP